MGQFEDMEVFVGVVESGGISRAARRLGMAKSAVSRRLSQLESRLGVELLTRTTRQSHLTDAGRRYFQRAQQVLTEVADLNADTAAGGRELEGPLQVALPLSFGLQHLAPLMTQFAITHPAVRLHLDFSDRKVDLVEEGFDMAVRIGVLSDSSLVARKLAPMRTIICASPAYLERYGEPRHPEDLRRHQVFGYQNPGTTTWRFLGPDGAAVSVSLRPSLTANNGDFLVDSAVAGLGIAMSPTFLCWRQVEAGKLARILADYRVETLNAHVVYPRRRFQSHRMRALIDFLTERLGDDPYWDREIFTLG